MAADRQPPTNVPAELLERGGDVRALRPAESQGTLIAELVPVVDGLRQMYTDFGLRPYRVFLVHVQWSGTARGEGVPTEISRREIVPTPRVRDMSATSEILRSTGLSEEGSLAVDQISGKFAEDDLMGRTPDLQEPSMPRTSRPAVEFFWEVQENRPNAPAALPRRYVPNAVPNISRDGFQWSVALTRQDYARARSGGMLPRSAY